MAIMDLEFIFFGDEIEEIESFDIENNQVIERFQELTIYPANLFVNLSRCTSKCNSSNSGRHGKASQLL